MFVTCMLLIALFAALALVRWASIDSWRDIEHARYLSARAGRR